MVNKVTRAMGMVKVKLDTAKVDMLKEEVDMVVIKNKQHVQNSITMGRPRLLVLLAWLVGRC